MTDLVEKPVPATWEDECPRKWIKVEVAPPRTPDGSVPSPRHGHRAIAFQHYIIMFGGGNEGIKNDLQVFDTVSCRWFQPRVNGEIPVGRAAFGFVRDECRILMFGGMTDCYRYSSDLYELTISNGECYWRKLHPKPPPKTESPVSRMGHSFTVVRGLVFLFGGLTNDSDNEAMIYPRFLNDMYTLHSNFNNGHGRWQVPICFGEPPSPRESHSTVLYSTLDGRRNKLIIYGGMNGCRLGDVHVFDIETFTWYRPEVGGSVPVPRSLHSATIVGQRMFVFGGWIPMCVDELKASAKEWKCSDILAVFDIEHLMWETEVPKLCQEETPSPRAGHIAVAISSRIYFWSGRDGFKSVGQQQLCLEDFWQLLVGLPSAPGKVQLLKEGTDWLEIGWNAVPDANSYILQCLAYDIPESTQVDASREAMSSAVAPTALEPPAPLPNANNNSFSTSAPLTPISNPANQSLQNAVIPAPIPNRSYTKPELPSVIPSTLVPASPIVIPTPQHFPSTNANMPPVAVNSLQLQKDYLNSSVQQTPMTASPFTTAPSNTPTTSLFFRMPASAPIVTTSVPPVPAQSQMITLAINPSSSLNYSLPANRAATASSMVVNKGMVRPPRAVLPVTAPSTPGRGVLRLRGPQQMVNKVTPVTGASCATSYTPSTIMTTTAATTASNEFVQDYNTMQINVATTAAMTTIDTTPHTVLQESPAAAQVGSVGSTSHPMHMHPISVPCSSPLPSQTNLTPFSEADSQQLSVHTPMMMTSNIPTIAGIGQQLISRSAEGSTFLNQTNFGTPSGTVALTPTPTTLIRPQYGKGTTVLRFLPISGTSGIPLGQSVSPSIFGLPGATTTVMQQAMTFSKTIPSLPGHPTRFVFVNHTVQTAQIGGIRAAPGTLPANQSFSPAIPNMSTGSQLRPVRMIVFPTANGTPLKGSFVRFVRPSALHTTPLQQIPVLSHEQTQGTIANIASGHAVFTPRMMQSRGERPDGKIVTVQVSRGQKPAAAQGQGLPTAGKESQGCTYVIIETQKPPGPNNPPVDAACSTVVDKDKSVERGLKGGSWFAPLSLICSSGLPWMKLKGGGHRIEKMESRYEHFLRKDELIPLYTVNTKFSWKSILNFGLKGGAGEEEMKNHFATPHPEQSSDSQILGSVVQPQAQASSQLCHPPSEGTALSNAPPGVGDSGTSVKEGGEGKSNSPEEAAPLVAEKWMDVAHTKDTKALVKCYYSTDEDITRLAPDTPVEKDVGIYIKKVLLKPATAYKFRVAAVNSCGRGPWSDVAAFKTCQPGYPGAPSSIKITRCADGASISWEPPRTTAGNIVEYSVYLAVKPTPNSPINKPGPTNLSFYRVYVGLQNACMVPDQMLRMALIDISVKPAIIFRIAAKNENGYGPATQVRWLQHVLPATPKRAPASATPSSAAKRSRTQSQNEN